MVREPHRTSLTGSPFVRLLAQLTEADASLSKHVFSERLSQWFHWTNASPLAAALGDAAEAPPQGGPAHRTASALDAEAARVRQGLERSIADDFARAPMARGAVRAPQPAAADAKADLLLWRRRYAAKQQAVEAGIHALRARLRDALCARSPAAARLAAVDEVMQQVLGEQERVLLSIVPKWLEQRFERSAAASPAADDGLDALRDDMRRVMLAELDFRWQPIDGLLAALRSLPPLSP